MTRKVVRSERDGQYHVAGHRYKFLIGSRPQVWHQTAYKTKAGLTKHDLHMNSRNRIVSKRKSATAKREKRLYKLGYRTKKGSFSLFKKLSGTAHSTKTKRR